MILVPEHLERVMEILALWLFCATVIMAGYVLPALLVDRRLAFGTWTRVGLAIFVILGPVGVLLEALLLAAVCRDVVAHGRIDEYHGGRSEPLPG
ncbi:MAG TPA: hypothetical protein VJ955_08005 [Desulfuromonadales bacterium]|nr:hypothetical protein [Desulfuromonadales bacterium]